MNRDTHIKRDAHLHANKKTEKDITQDDI